MGENSLFSLKGLPTLQSPSHTIITRCLKEIRNMPQLQETHILKGISSLSTEGTRLFASRVYSASCHSQLYTFSTGDTLTCQPEQWSRTSKRDQQHKQHEFRGVSQLISWVKPVFPAVFLTLLHDRVAEMPRKWLGRHLPGHGRIPCGCTTAGSGGFVTSWLHLPELCCSSHFDGSEMHIPCGNVQDAAPGRCQHTSTAQWIIWRSGSLCTLFLSSPEEGRTLVISGAISG